MDERSRPWPLARRRRSQGVWWRAAQGCRGGGAGIDRDARAGSGTPIGRALAVARMRGSVWERCRCASRWMRSCLSHRPDWQAVCRGDGLPSCPVSGSPGSCSSPRPVGPAEESDPPTAPPPHCTPHLAPLARGSFRGSGHIPGRTAPGRAGGGEGAGRHAQRFKAPPVSREDFLAILDKSACSSFATALDKHWGFQAD